MNRADAALAVAEKGLEDARTALEAIEQIKKAPQGAFSFALDDDGFLSVTLPDGTSKTLGNVRGEPGPRGEPGGTGKDGVPGADGRNGKDGAPGLDAAPARDGRDGQRGEHGRDAIQISILPAIDVTRSYPRGTYAKHQNALVTSLRTTEPLGEGPLEASGWDIVIESPKAVEMTNVSARIKRIELVFASGKRERLEFNVPCTIYRGVFREADEYEAGDMVTWGGSVWHCNKSGTEMKPGNNTPDWQLAVKRGNDGRDGTPGEKGERGLDGLPGRNGKDKV